jgi:hypothetical protein
LGKKWLAALACVAAVNTPHKKSGYFILPVLSLRKRKIKAKIMVFTADSVLNALS